MQLNIIEKKAYFGLGFTFIGLILVVLLIGRKNLWFEPKNSYFSYYRDVEGLTEGSLVTLSGLRVGEVQTLTVENDNRIKVTFSVKKSLEEKIRSDSLARQHRSFVIGEKGIDIIPGTSEGKLILANQEVKGFDSMELPDLISGKNIGLVSVKLEGLLLALEKWSRAFTQLSDKMGPNDLATFFKQVSPLVANINSLLAQNGPLIKTLNNTNTILSPIAKREELLETTLENVNTLMQEIDKGPGIAKDVIGLLREVSLTLKAMQKTWLLKSHVEDVKKGEATSK